MKTLLNYVHLISALIVLAEALNKLERISAPLHWRSAHDRWVNGLKALAWILLALGAAGALAVPFFNWTGIPVGLHPQFLRLEAPTLEETCVMLGFAVLIIRTRIKEG